MVSLKLATLAAPLLAALAAAAPAAAKDVSSATCFGQKYTYRSLAGYGLVAPDARDKFGDTIGGIGSAVAFEAGSWQRKKDGERYEGTLWVLPDRGWNTQGTLNVQNRVHKFEVRLELDKKDGDKKKDKAKKPNVELKYRDTVLLSGPDGQPTTGLDADPSGALTYPGFPPLPASTYTGDGFGGPGAGGKRVAVDAEGLVLGKDGSFWVSDEYGPYVYRFDRKGKMVEAVRPADAYIPIRNGTESFNSATPPFFDPERTIDPEDPTSGRGNNQGFEGLAISPSGRTLSALLQSAAIQEGGSSSSKRRHARLAQFDLSSGKPVYTAEFVVPLPLYTNNEGKQRVAAQSEVLALSDTRFLVLARDSDAGRGVEFTESKYRRADIFDISKATNVKGAEFDGRGGAVASEDGELKAGIKAAEYCSFLDYNVNSELAKFGLRNGGEQAPGLLDEKWESLALVPVDGKEGKDGEFFLFSAADNDFQTSNGRLNFGKFEYEDVVDVDSQVLVFRVKLPSKK